MMRRHQPKSDRHESARSTGPLTEAGNYFHSRRPHQNRHRAPPQPDRPHNHTHMPLEIAVMSQTPTLNAALSSSFTGFQLARGQEELTAR